MSDEVVSPRLNEEALLDLAFEYHPLQELCLVVLTVTSTHINLSTGARTELPTEDVGGEVVLLSGGRRDVVLPDHADQFRRGLVIAVEQRSHDDGRRYPRLIHIDKVARLYSLI